MLSILSLSYNIVLSFVIYITCDQLSFNILLRLKDTLSVYTVCVLKYYAYYDTKSSNKCNSNLLALIERNVH